MNTKSEHTCEKISSHLDTQSDLDPSILDHIQNCSDSNNFLQAWKPQGNLHSAATSPTTTALPSLADQIIKKLPESQTTKPTIIRFTPLLITAAAITIGFFIWKPNTTPPIQSKTLTTTTTSPQSITDVPEIIKTIQTTDINASITSLAQSSSEIINNKSKSIQKITSTIEYVSTNLSKLIPPLKNTPKSETYIHLHSTNQA